MSGSRGVMVCIPDSNASDPGSNLDGACVCFVVVVAVGGGGGGGGVCVCVCVIFILFYLSFNSCSSNITNNFNCNLFIYFLCIFLGVNSNIMENMLHGCIWCDG